MKTIKDVERSQLSHAVHMTAWVMPWIQTSPPRGDARARSGGELGWAVRLSFETKASFQPPLYVVSKAPGVVGKVGVVVSPVTYALPEASAASEDPTPSPRKVE